MTWVLFALLGIGAGAYGALIGAGGGFILVPILLLLHPDWTPLTVTSISLAVVFVNAVSASLAYVRQRRVDFLAGLTFAPATFPGSIAGALVVQYLPRRPFSALFGVLLVLLGIVLVQRGRRSAAAGKLPAKAAIGKWHASRRIVDSAQREHIYAYNQPLGIAIAAGVGFISSLLGVGGGIVMVPAMTQLLSFPAHVATATSTFILTGTSLTATIVHVVNSDLANVWSQTLAIGAGMIVGGQLGARLSQRVRGAVILRALAIALMFVGARLFLGALFGQG